MTSNERDRQREGPPTPDEPTRTAESVGASTAQPAVAPSLFRAQERYQILGEHGRGGLGKVSRAHDRELGRDVAIKELIARGAIGEVRFLREAMITARLEHPGIVPVHEAGRWADGTPYYAMKLVAGRPLRELIAAPSRNRGLFYLCAAMRRYAPEVGPQGRGDRLTWQLAAS